MLRLDHDNIIQAQDVPEPLLAVQENEEIPMLAMEYCSEGDLRNVRVHIVEKDSSKMSSKSVVIIGVAFKLNQVKRKWMKIDSLIF